MVPVHRRAARPFTPLHNVNINGSVPVHGRATQTSKRLYTHKKIRMPSAKAARIYREMLKGIHEADTEINRERPGRTAEEMNEIIKNEEVNAEVERLMRKARASNKHRNTLKHAARRERAKLERKAARREELYQILLDAANEIDAERDADTLTSLMGLLSVDPSEVSTEEMEKMKDMLDKLHVHA